ncbi:MAG TPA: hypothetical protein VFZ72_24020 [Jiangellaceae bacterium]
MVGLVPVVAAVVLALAVPWQLDGLLDPPQVAVPASQSRRTAAAELVPSMGRHLLVIPPATAIGMDNLALAHGGVRPQQRAHLHLWEGHPREHRRGPGLRPCCGPSIPPTPSTRCAAPASPTS